MASNDYKKRKEAGIKSFNAYRIPNEIKDRVKLVDRRLIVGLYQGQKLDLRKQTPDRLLAIAKAGNYPALQYIEKKEAKPDPEPKKPKSNPAPKKPPKPKKKGDDKDTGERAGE